MPVGAAGEGLPPGERAATYPLASFQASPRRGTALGRAS